MLYGVSASMGHTQAIVNTKSEWSKRVSVKSDRYEQAVCDAIHGKGPYTARRVNADVRYSDVRVCDGGSIGWVECKMNHTDNLLNPRVWYNGFNWTTNSFQRSAVRTTSLLNSSTQATQFIRELREFTGRDHVIIKSQYGKGRDPRIVSLEEMNAFMKERTNRYVLTWIDKDIGWIAEEHWREDFIEPASYLQTADSFYRIGDANPLGLSEDIPIVHGVGCFKVRVVTRSRFYEVQTEMKFRKGSMPVSPYSVFDNGGKINPFERR